MYEKRAKTTSILSVPKNKVKLDQKLIEISYKKGGPLKSVTPLHASGCFHFPMRKKKEIERVGKITGVK